MKDGAMVCQEHVFIEGDKFFAQAIFEIGESNPAEDSLLVQYSGANFPSTHHCLSSVAFALFVALLFGTVSAAIKRG